MGMPFLQVEHSKPQFVRMLHKKDGRAQDRRQRSDTVHLALLPIEPQQRRVPCFRGPSETPVDSGQKLGQFRGQNLGRTLNAGARKAMPVKREPYLDLVRQFPLRPIRSEKVLDRATKVIDSLIDCTSLSADQRDYLNVLSDLVEAYEEERYPMPKISDARMLRHLIEARGVSQTEVAKATGIANSTISAVLKGVRQLTREHIGQLAKYFHVEPGVFIFGEQEQPSKKPRTGIGLRRSKEVVAT